MEDIESSKGINYIPESPLAVEIKNFANEYSPRLLRETAEKLGLSKLADKLSPAILDDEVYDPKKELEELKAIPRDNKEVRDQAKRDFRERLSYFYRDSAHMQIDILNIMAENPEATSEELIASVSSIFKKYEKVSGVDEKLEHFKTNITERQNAIHQLIAESENKEDLFERLFGAQPAGNFEVIKTPIGLILSIEDATDYNLTISNELNGVKGDYAKELNGKVLFRHNVKGLEMGVIAVNATPESRISSKKRTQVVTHEIQHSLHWLTQDIGLVRNLAKDSSEDLNQIFNNMSEKPWEEAKPLLEKEVNDVRTALFALERSEALAFLSDEVTVNRVEERITGAQSVYAEDPERAAQLLKNTVFATEGKYAAELAFMSSTVIDRVLGMEYKIIEKNSYEAMRTLQNRGFTNAEIAFILQHHDFETWPKIVGRMTD